MADHPVIAAALRNAAAEAAGIEPNPRDVIMGAYGNTLNLGQVVGQEPQSYGEYSRNLGVYPSNGSYYHPLSMRDAYEQHDIPPVPYTRGGYAPLAWRSFVNPWGQMMVQPLVGGISKYPHVLPGVPRDLGNQISWAMGMLGPLPQYQPPAMPMQRTAAIPRTASVSQSKGNGTPPQTNTAPTQSQQQASPATGGPYDETVWRNRTMPRNPMVAPVQNLQPVVQPHVTASQPVLPYVDDGVNYDINAREDSNPVQDFYDYWGNLLRTGGVDPNATWSDGGFTTPQPIQNLQPPVQVPVPQRVAPEFTVPNGQPVPMPMNTAMRPSAVRYYG